MANTSRVEVLIHISAPSRASDDVHYRSQASAYLEFCPQKNRRLGDSDDFLFTRPDEIQNQGHHISQSNASFPGILPSLRSPQASFQSVLDNANSPRRYRTHGTLSPQRDEQRIQASWQTPPSVIEDSIPGNNLMLTTLTTPTRVLEHYLQRFESSPVAPGSRAQPLATNDHAGNLDDAIHADGHHSFRSDRSDGNQVIPCTPANKLQSMKLEREPSPQPSLSNSGRIDSTTGRVGPDHVSIPYSDEVINDTILHSQSPAAERADSEPPPSTTKRQKHQALPSSPRAILRSSSDIGPRRGVQSAGSGSTFYSVHGFGYHSLELYSPDPPVANESLVPGDLVTPGLRRLADDLQIPKRFRPEAQTRELRPFERGFWKLDCSTWADELKLEAWTFLANYIGTGVAGWGLSCRRDDEFRSLRVYCWGGIVAHVFLLLYLASKRKILYTGAHWVDGDGDAVIIMGTRA
ncbi:hypothetical protein BX600DRAFT_453652 [Xylariales sp. PMI_506]|nr:hypothetical protein BX600DRAFT_453652 [Xylariales sp. PMI_506]